MSSDEEWDEGVYEDINEAVCPFCDTTSAGSNKIWIHVKDVHSFDFNKIKKEWKLDFFECIKLINYLRKLKSEGNVEENDVKINGTWRKDDALLAPVIEDDVLLINLDDDDELCEDEIISGDINATSTNNGALMEENMRLKARIAELTTCLQHYKTIANDLLVVDAVEVAEKLPALNSNVASPVVDNDTYYFDSYSHYGIHEEMLKDRVRTEAYQKLFLDNSDFFKGKVVLDVGCGTGILSMFAARAGAKKVYGVDMSGIIEDARQIVHANKFDDVITLIRGKVEEITLPVDQVDVIVSEWMGYCLLYESMLPSVLFARNKWLVEGGAVYPDLAYMYVEAIQDHEWYFDKMQYWESVYGFNMLTIRKYILPEAAVEVFDGSKIVSDRYTFKTLDLTKTETEDLDFESPFTLTAAVDGMWHCILISFDNDFVMGCKEVIKLPTGAKCTPTHWKQTGLILETPIKVSAGDKVSGKVILRRREKNPRQYDVSLVLENISNATSFAATVQHFTLK